MNLSSHEFPTSDGGPLDGHRTGLGNLRQMTGCHAAKKEEGRRMRRRDQLTNTVATIKGLSVKFVIKQFQGLFEIESWRFLRGF